MLTDDQAWQVGVESVRAGVKPSIESCADGLPKSEAEVHTIERAQGQVTLNVATRSRVRRPTPQPALHRSFVAPSSTSKWPNLRSISPRISFAGIPADETFTYRFKVEQTCTY